MRIDLKCAPGSPEDCIVTDLKLQGYSTGQVVRVTNGKKVSKSTEANSCPTGWKIWSPRSKADWTVVYDKLGKNINNYPMKPQLIVDVTRGDNTCGGCGNHAMKSTVSQQSSWKTTDCSAWWLRDTKYTEPNGDYHANCYLSVSEVDPDDVQFNDINCGSSSEDYLCQRIGAFLLSFDFIFSFFTRTIQYLQVSPSRRILLCFPMPCCSALENLHLIPVARCT